MAQRLDNRDKLSFKISDLNDNEVTEVLEYISSIETMRGQQRGAEAFEDDIITGLAEAEENRRARIVHEWDRVRRRADQRTVMSLAARR